MREMAEGVEPACVTACPTGALKFAEQDAFDPVNVEWFPETGIGPSLILRGADNSAGPVIIPSEALYDREEEEVEVELTRYRIRHLAGCGRSGACWYSHFWLSQPLHL